MDEHHTTIHGLVDRYFRDLEYDIEKSPLGYTVVLSVDTGDYRVDVVEGVIEEDYDYHVEKYVLTYLDPNLDEYDMPTFSIVPTDESYVNRLQ